MADLADVEIALVSAVTSALYPDGIGALSITGAGLKVFRGSPSEASLSRDLRQGAVSVSIFAVPDDSKPTTRWGVQSSARLIPATLTVAVVANTITLGGIAQLGQVVGILADQQVFVYRTQGADTPSVVARALVKSVQVARPCLVAGSTITILGVFRLLARVATDAFVTSEWARQEQAFRMTVCAPGPKLRDLVCTNVIQTLARLSFLNLADGTSGRLMFRKTVNSDDEQDGGLFRRDVFYGVEYATTTSMLQPTMLFGEVLVGSNEVIG